MLTKTFTFIDDDMKDTHSYFQSYPSRSNISTNREYNITRQYGSLVYYTGYVSDGIYVSTDLLKLCEFIKGKLNESN